jgi:hypothetical protein
VDDDGDYAMRVIAARAPEVADQVVSVEVLEQVLAVIEALQDRLAELAEQVEGRMAA